MNIWKVRPLGNAYQLISADDTGQFCNLIYEVSNINLELIEEIAYAHNECVAKYLESEKTI